MTVQTFSKDELNFVKQPPEEIAIDCSICLNVMLETSSLTSCCGHHFCQSCISKWGTEKRSCPQCRAPDYQTMLDKDRIRYIRGLRVYCSNDGCGWTGELKDLPDHIMRGRRYGECNFELVKCCHHGCDTSGMRCSIYKHEEEDCQLRQYQCPYCFDHSDTYLKVMSEHYAVCSRYPVRCQNDSCQLVVARAEMEAHVQYHCPFQLIDCGLKWVGCPEKTLRKDSTKHLYESMAKHCAMLETASRELHAACNSLMFENQMLKNDYEQLKDSHIQLEKRCMDLQSQNENLSRMCWKPQHIYRRK